MCFRSLDGASVYVPLGMWAKKCLAPQIALATDEPFSSYYSVQAYNCKALYNKQLSLVHV